MFSFCRQGVRTNIFGLNFSRKFLFCPGVPVVEVVEAYYIKFCSIHNQKIKMYTQTWNLSDYQLLISIIQVSKLFH